MSRKKGDYTSSILLTEPFRIFAILLFCDDSIILAGDSALAPSTVDR
jgi:hypothetical protein